MNKGITVRQLNLYVKSLLESDVKLNYITVQGELSNFKNHYQSGHWYFTLKDKDASVRCMMFASYSGKVGFNPKDGDYVVVTGRVSLYENDGQYQFYANSMNPFGEGDALLDFNRIKEKLEKEGLFDQESKRKLPEFPQKIAVVTSDTGAAIHDISSTLSGRLPTCKIVVCPTNVQGVNAAESMIKILDRVYSLSGIDAVIIGRGGGSAEDLSAFNNEALARKIYESPFPVVSAVGHETDFTICDFVSDARAATPTAAAIALSTGSENVLLRIKESIKRISNSINNIVERNEMKYKLLSSSATLSNPIYYFENKEKKIREIENNLVGCFSKKIENSQNNFIKITGQLDKLSPLKILGRGYSLVTKDGKIISSNDRINVEDEISIKFANGGVKAVVKEKING